LVFSIRRVERISLHTDRQLQIALLTHANVNIHAGFRPCSQRLLNGELEGAGRAFDERVEGLQLKIE